MASNTYRPPWLPEGLHLQVAAKGNPHHAVMVTATGEKLRLPSGMPVHCSTSPSDHRTRKIELSRIRKALEARDGRA